jgi:putative membrane protein insertion efficiency factor
VALASSPPEQVEQPPDSVPGSEGPVARLLIAAVRAYQLARIGRVSPCRFTPTCSQYAVDAVSRHGARKGLALAARRLGRCRPGGPYGFDPVPEHPLSRMRDQ